MSDQCCGKCRYWESRGEDSGDCTWVVPIPYAVEIERVDTSSSEGAYCPTFERRDEG